MLNKISKNFSLAIGAVSAVLLLGLRLIKVSPLWGGCFSYFSLTDILMPLSGMGGFALAIFLFATRILFRVCALNAGLSTILYHIPGLSASFYWSQERLQRLIGMIVPIICAILFIIHPVGKHAALYTVLWSIPFLISLVGRLTPFTKSLTSTFIAHAVGSVIWLYTKNLASFEWLALIPVVLIERFTFAGIMTGTYYLARYGQKVYRAYSMKTRSIH